MSRWTALVYGVYPPAGGAAAAATLASVRAFLADGADVVVVSPQPSGAHHHADLRRTIGALRLARWAGTAERVVLHLETGQLCGSLPRGALMPPGRLAIGLALRRPREVVVHCTAVGGALDARSVRVVLGPASRVVAASAEDRDALLAAGLAAGKVEVAAASPVRVRVAAAAAGAANGDVPSPPDRTPWEVPATAGREEIQAEIRRRAAQRSGQATGSAAAGHLPGTPTTRPLLALRPLGPAPVSSAKPGFRFVKRLIHKAIGWQVDPVIEHVNRLQRATLEALENEGPRTPGTG